MVLGSEVFYDEGILADIAHVLEQVLTSWGKGFFCDPNRLGLDTIELGFQEKFILAIEKNPSQLASPKRNRWLKIRKLTLPFFITISRFFKVAESLVGIFGPIPPFLFFDCLSCFPAPYIVY